MSLEFGRADDAVAARRRVVLDPDSSEIPVYGEQEQTPTTSSARPDQCGCVQREVVPQGKSQIPYSMSGGEEGNRLFVAPLTKPSVGG